MRGVVGRGAREAANVLWPLGVAVMITAAAFAALGRPDLSQARDFLTSGRPDRAGALATIEATVWLLVAGLFLLQLFETVRRSPPVRARAGNRRLRAQIVLLSGLMIFVGGAIRHQADTGSLCCGDTAGADRLAR